MWKQRQYFATEIFLLFARNKKQKRKDDKE